MNSTTNNHGMRVIAILSVLAVMFSFSARAALYTYNYTDSGAIPQGGTTFSAEHTLNPSAGNPINGVTLVLTFNNSYDLNGKINGTLILDPSGSATFASFTPAGAGLTVGTGGQEIYTVSFSSFNGQDPNNLWALNLWDNNTSGIENGLVSWTLNITSPQVVPEPITYALGLFGLAFVVIGAGRFYLGRLRKAR
jgi:hypothetical protein